MSTGREACGGRTPTTANSILDSGSDTHLSARRGTVDGVGGDVPRGQYSVRYPRDIDDAVALLTVTSVPELVAARAWQRADR